MSVVGLPAARAVVLWRNTNRVFFANVVSLKIYVSGDESLVAARGRPHAAQGQPTARQHGEEMESQGSYPASGELN